MVVTLVSSKSVSGRAEGIDYGGEGMVKWVPYGCGILVVHDFGGRIGFRDRPCDTVGKNGRARLPLSGVVDSILHSLPT